MNHVVTRGTARHFAFYTPKGELGMGGKTSMVQVCKIHQHERQKGVVERDDNLKDHRIFVGYGPVKQPQYVVTAIVEHAGKSKIAIEISKEIMEQLVLDQ